MQTWEYLQNNIWALCQGWKTHPSFLKWLQLLIILPVNLLCLFVSYYLVWSFRHWYMLFPHMSALIRLYCFFLSDERLIFCSASSEDVFFDILRTSMGFPLIFQHYGIQEAQYSCLCRNFSRAVYSQIVTQKAALSIRTAAITPFLTSHPEL